MADIVKSQWLEQRRDFFVRNVVRDFLQSMSFFSEIKDRRKGGKVSYDKLEEWIGTKTHRGTLWLLKDRCHRLWNGADSAEQTEGFLFDWMVGAIFHEAMKLKENVYIVERYEPAYLLAMSSSGADGRKSRYEGFFDQALAEIGSGIDKLDYLFSQTAEHLKCMILKERDNALLLRFLLEARTGNEEFLRNAIDIEDLLDVLFPEGLQEAYCVAGESYLEGSWYAEARAAFEESIRIDKGWANAYAGLRILDKRIEEVTLMLQKEYASPRTKNNTARREPGCPALDKVSTSHDAVSTGIRPMEPGIARPRRTLQ